MFLTENNTIVAIISSLLRCDEETNIDYFPQYAVAKQSGFPRKRARTEQRTSSHSDGPGTTVRRDVRVGLKSTSHHSGSSHRALNI